MNTRRFAQSILVLAVVAWTIPLAAAADITSKRPAPLFEGLGERAFVVTTKSPEAQRYFNQGVALLYAFNHAEAIRSFEAAAKLDPQCAMAYWGVSYGHGPNINRPMDEIGAQKAWRALQQAQKLSNETGEREKAYIGALAKRYAENNPTNRADLDKAYADAMRAVARQFPDDLHASTLFAEALMDTTPWNYWGEDGQLRPEIKEALASLKQVMARDPLHPGANHFFIHAVEAGPNPEEALPSADRLGKVAPAAGHLVHMPSHIYVRVGQYHDATEVNRRACDVDQDYISHCRAQGFYPGMYYPHNIHFTWFSASIEGRSKLALDSAKRVAMYGSDPRCGVAEVAESIRFRHLPQLTQARFGQWDEVLKAPAVRVTTNAHLFDRAMWHYSRTLAHAAKGNGPEAARESGELTKIVEGPDVKTLDTPFFPATGVLEVARRVAAAKAAGAQGETKTEITELEKAVNVQDALPYMEPPYWYYSTRESLGAALLKAGELARAEEVFRDNLKRYPRHPWTLFGLEQTLRKQGKTEAADRVQREFREAWKHADAELNLAMF